MFRAFFQYCWDTFEIRATALKLLNLVDVPRAGPILQYGRRDDVH